MKIKSFIRDIQGLVPVEVELNLWPGLPIIQFLGQADQQIKESALRIKSAIKSQGFEFPKSRQILVNLRPNHLKKNSRGLELAVVVAYLLETEQIQIQLPANELFVYGELTLSGEVFSPEDISLGLSKISNCFVLTGKSESSIVGNGEIACVENLGDLSKKINFSRQTILPEFIRPPLNNLALWTKEEADLLAITATGEHHLLLAGPSGSGKTTMATTLHALMPAPSESLAKEIYAQSQVLWRPLVRPHHTTPAISMIGGGSVAKSGEITRAHGGLLVMDEFLEFHSDVLEALREPFEEGKIKIARAGECREFPACSQIVATTNLCPCGAWVPQGAREVRIEPSCMYSRRRCQSYAQRLSGPLLDRFHMVSFTNSKNKERKIHTNEVLERVEQANKFRLERKQTCANARVRIESILALGIEDILPNFGSSVRRRNATIRVARTIADLEQVIEIRPAHIHKALSWTKNNFDRLILWN